MDHRCSQLLINQRVVHVPHDRISLFLMGSFKIQALSQEKKRQPIYNSAGEAQSQAKQIENVLELRLLLEFPLAAWLCLLMLFLTF